MVTSTSPASRHALPHGSRRRARLSSLGQFALAISLALPAGIGVSVVHAEDASAASCVVIASARFDPPGDDDENLNEEWVEVANRCSTMIGVGGWKLRDRVGNTYTFQSGVRMGKGSIYVHTGKGTDRPGHRHWGKTWAVWDNVNEVATLYNSGGTKLSVWTGPTAGSGVWATPFATRPRSPAISLRDCRDRVISNKTFKDLGANVIAIKLVNCHNVTISAVDFENVAEGVYAVNSTNIKVVDSRYRNIIGPHERVGLNRANFVQFHRVNGGLIDHNKGIGGDTEDVVSLYQTSNVIVEDNHFEGTNWESTSSSGIALGDGAGSNNIARRNKLLNIGQVGIFIAGGTNNKILDNVIYGERRPNSNVGIYVNKYSDGTCSGHTVSGNRVRFWNDDGVLNGYWQGTTCGTVTKVGNDFAAPLNLAGLRVVL